MLLLRFFLCATLDLNATELSYCDACERACVILQPADPEAYQILKWEGLLTCEDLSMEIVVYTKIVDGITYKCFRSACLGYPEGSELCEVHTDACPNFSISVTDEQLWDCGLAVGCPGGTLRIHCDPRFKPPCDCPECLCRCLCLTLLDIGGETIKRACWDNAAQHWTVTFNECTDSPLVVVITIEKDAYDNCVLVVDVAGTSVDHVEFPNGITCPTVSFTIAGTDYGGESFELTGICATCDCPCAPCACFDGMEDEVCTLYAVVEMVSTGSCLIRCANATDSVTLPWSEAQHAWAGGNTPSALCPGGPDSGQTLAIKVYCSNGSMLLDVLWGGYLINGVSAETFSCDPTEATYIVNVTEGLFMPCGGPGEVFFLITITE